MIGFQGVRIRICIFALMLPISMMAGLVRFEVTERSAVLQGKAFGASGAYERFVGRAYFEVDPEAPANQLIPNINQADRNARARAPFFPTFSVLSPADP